MRRRTGAILLAFLWLCSAACSGSPGNKSTTTTPRTTSTTPPAPLLLDTALPGLLLPPEVINPVMKATDMAVTETHFAMTDDSAAMQPLECVAVDGAAQVLAYKDSGFTAEREQTLREPDKFDHYVKQAVVLFGSAKQAQGFVTASGKQWGACHQYTHLQSGSEWTVAPISTANGMLSTIAAQQNATEPGWACGRAMTARNNAVIDINTCSADPGNSAVEIATQIAAKVPG
jgi:PknH-like extracellular domain